MDPNIRIVTICDINGKMMYSDYREGIENLLTPEESKRSLNLAVNSWKTRSQLATKIGKGKYVLAVYVLAGRCSLKNSSQEINFWKITESISFYQVHLYSWQ